MMEKGRKYIQITVGYYQLELILYDVSANLRFLIKNKNHPYFKNWRAKILVDIDFL